MKWTYCKVNSEKGAQSVPLKIFSLFTFFIPGNLNTLAGVFYINDQNITIQVHLTSWSPSASLLETLNTLVADNPCMNYSFRWPLCVAYSWEPSTSSSQIDLFRSGSRDISVFPILDCFCRLPADYEIHLTAVKSGLCEFRS